MPEDFKPFEAVGPGTYEVRISTSEGGEVQHRIFFVAKFAEAVYVLHAFRRTTRETSRHDVEVGKARYREMLRARAGRR